jgi:hypothetical protein
VAQFLFTRLNRLGWLGWNSTKPDSDGICSFAASYYFDGPIEVCRHILEEFNREVTPPESDTMEAVMTFSNEVRQRLE